MDRQTSELAERWQFHPTEELPGGHCSRVYADATRVLKVPFQGEELLSGFRAALRLANTVGPKIYESDPDTGTILMERLTPGTTLLDANIPDQDQLDIAASFALQIQGHDRSGCMPLEDFIDSKDPLARQLLETTTRQVFLHGDLHHFNILRHGQAWLAIDPKGVSGDPAYEPPPYLRNPINEIPTLPDLEELTRARVHQFAARLNLDPWRIIAWALVDRRSSDEGDPAWQRVITVFEGLEDEMRGSA